MLKDILPAKYRQIVYRLYAAAAVIAGALAVAGVDTGKTPDVLAYLGGALGFVAAANVAPAKPRGEDGAVEPGSLALGLFVGALVVYLIRR